MAGRARDLIAADVHKLITQLSGFSETEDPENFELCEKFAFSNLLHHRYLSVDSHAVRRSVFGMVTKFMIHGHIEASRRLDSLLNKYLKLNVFKDKDVQWAVLSLLVKLADNPTSHIDDNKFSTSEVEAKEDASKPFDWTTYSHLCDYLKEGNENFDTNFNASSDSEWEDMSSDHDGIPKIMEVSCKAVALPQTILEVPEEQHDTERTQLVEHHRRCCTAEEWLAENVQNPWWSSTEITERVDSVFPSANLARLWDSYCDDSTSTLSEYKVLREILWMLQAPTTTMLFQEVQGQFIVQPNMTIPSLTKSSTSGYLNTLCEYFTMIFNLQKFQKEIFPMDSNTSGELNTKIAPHTYEAYTAAVVEFLRTIQGLACEIEKKVKKQDDIYTLYSLNLELAPKMSQLRAVYNVHVNATKGWKEAENWLSSARLLSVLYGEALACMECDSPCVLLKMFLKSFRPYVDMIDLWLTEGRLEDYRNEFIITKRETVEDEDWGNDFAMRPFIDILKTNGITPLPLLQVIADKVLHAGRSMQLLQRLDRLGDMRAQNSNCGRMYGEFLLALEKEIALLMKDHSKSEENATVEEPSTSDSDKNPSCSERFLSDVTNQLEEFKDNFLMQAFRDYIPFKAVTQRKEPETFNITGDIFRRLAMYSTCGLMPLKPVMERILSQLIDSKHSTACLIVKNIFLYEFNLSTHLGLIRAIYLMEAGDIMHRFCLFIFQEVERSLIRANSYTLTVQLEECINLRYPDHSSKFSVAVKEDATLNGTPSVMDEISVEYHVEWPLTVILSPKNMEYYNAVFQFLLKVKWALWTLEGLRFSDLVNSGSNDNPALKGRARCLHLLRFWLLHSVGSVHTYLMGQVLHSLGLQLEQDLNNASDLDSLVQAHNKYVNLVHNHCLQPRSSDVIKTTILQMVQLSLELHEIWSQGVELIEDAKLLSMTDMYIKCHCFLGSVLQTAVDLGQASHLPAPVSFSSSSALNKSQIFADHMQYSLAFLAWQQEPPLGISSPLPKHLHKFLENDIWNEKRSDTTLNTHKLEVFLDNYFLYISGIRNQIVPKASIQQAGNSCTIMQSNTHCVYNNHRKNIQTRLSTLLSEACVSDYSPLSETNILPIQDSVDKPKQNSSSDKNLKINQIQESENENCEFYEPTIKNFNDGAISEIEGCDPQTSSKINELPNNIPKLTLSIKQSSIGGQSSKPLLMNVLTSVYEEVDEKPLFSLSNSTNETPKSREVSYVNLQVFEDRNTHTTPVISAKRTVQPQFSSVLHIQEKIIEFEKKSALIEVQESTRAEISTSLISCTIPLQNIPRVPISSHDTSKDDGLQEIHQEFDTSHDISPEFDTMEELTADVQEVHNFDSSFIGNPEDEIDDITNSNNLKQNEKSLLLNQRTLKNIRQKCVKPNIKHSSKSGRRFYDCGSNILTKPTSPRMKKTPGLLPPEMDFVPLRGPMEATTSSGQGFLDIETNKLPTDKGILSSVLSPYRVWLQGTQCIEQSKETIKVNKINKEIMKKHCEKLVKPHMHLKNCALHVSNRHNNIDSENVTNSFKTCAAKVVANRLEEKKPQVCCVHKQLPDTLEMDNNREKTNRVLKENSPLQKQNYKEEDRKENNSMQMRTTSVSKCQHRSRNNR